MTPTNTIPHDCYRNENLKPRRMNLVVGNAGTGANPDETNIIRAIILRLFTMPRPKLSEQCQEFPIPKYRGQATKATRP